MEGEAQVFLTGHLLHVNEGPSQSEGSGQGKFVGPPPVAPPPIFGAGPLIYVLVNGLLLSIPLSLVLILLTQEPAGMVPGSSPSPLPTGTANLTPEQIQRAICALTGDCDPQPDTGGICLPPPTPPPTDQCDGDEPLEGETDYQVNNPNDPSDTITDIDRIKGGILWEVKTATFAIDVESWVRKQIRDKFYRYLRARQYLSCYENAPIGFEFQGSTGIDLTFKSPIKAEVQRLRIENPGVDILLRFLP